MANPYPADIQDGAGNVRISGKVNFTDPDNQPGGGSQTVNFWDFGTVTIAELLADGPKTLYTPDGPELVWFHLGSDSVSIDNQGYLGFEPLNALANPLGAVFYFADNDPGPPPNPNVQDQVFYGAGNDPFPGLYVLSAPLVATFNPQGAIPASGALGVWQANHAYAVGAIVLGDSVLQIVTTAGTSDGSEPVWDTVGGTTTDGGVTWQNYAVPPPTVGSAHVYALVGEPTVYTP